VLDSLAQALRRSAWPVFARRHIAVVGLAIGYVVVMSLFSLWAYHGLRTQMDDLGNMAQALWGAAHGDWLMRQSNDVDGVLRSRLAVHSNLIFWLLALPYRLWPDPRLLLVTGGVACGFTGVGLYALARHRFGGSRWALIPPIAFWLSPAVQDANLYDFHAVTLVAAFLVWMVWAFEAGRPKLAWTLLVLALLCQEHVAAITACFGLYRLLTGHRREGLALVAVSVAYATLNLGVLAPLVNGGATISKISGPDNRYRWIARHPAAVLATVSQPDHLRIVVYLLLAGAIACLAQWRFLLLLLPGVLGAVLAGGPWMSRISGTYYWVTEEAVLAMGCILAASSTARAPSRGPLVYLLAATAALSLLLSPLPYGLASGWDNHDRAPRTAVLDEVMRAVPPEAALTVQNNLGGPLAGRPLIARFPRRLATSEYAVFYLRHVGGADSGLFVRPDLRLLTGMDAESLAVRVGSFLSSTDWSLVQQRDGFYLFHRGSGPRPSPQALARFQKDAETLLGQYAAAEEHRKPWARFLVDPWVWPWEGTMGRWRPVVGRR
jgi:uncharacterized membrane protein